MQRGQENSGGFLPRGLQMCEDSWGESAGVVCVCGCVYTCEYVFVYLLKIHKINRLH